MDVGYEYEIELHPQEMQPQGIALTVKYGLLP